MANTLITSEMVAKTALALLQGDLVLGALVNRAAESDFNGKVGATIHVRRPATLQARTRALGSTVAITVDDLNEADQPITLDEHAYSAVRVSDEDLTLNILDFARQVLKTQVLAIARYIEDKVADVMATVPASAIVYDAANPRKALLAARKALLDMGVTGEIIALVGTSVEADLLIDEKLSDASASGDASALRDAIVGRVSGCTVVRSNLIPTDSLIVFHRDAFTLAVVAPVVPEGVAFGQSVNEGGYAIRAIRDYDSSTLADRSVVSTFVGARVNTLEKPDGTDVIPAVRIDTTP